MGRIVVNYVQLQTMFCQSILKKRPSLLSFRCWLPQAPHDVLRVSHAPSVVLGQDKRGFNLNAAVDDRGILNYIIPEPFQCIKMLRLQNPVWTFHVLSIIKNYDVFGAAFVGHAHLVVHLGPIGQVWRMSVLPSYYGAPTLILQVRRSSYQTDFLGNSVVPA